MRERWQEKGQEQEKGCSWNESKSNSSAGPPSFLILAFELHFIVSLGTVFHLFSSSANFRQLSRPISRAYDLCRHTGSRKGPELGVLISAADLKFSIILNKAHAVSFCAGSHK